MVKPSDTALRTDTTKGDQELVNSLYSPHTPWNIVPKNWHQLPSDTYSFDREEAVRHMEALRSQYGFDQVKISGNKRKFTYRGLAFTARPESEDPLYDALNVYSDAETQLDINTVIGSTSERSADRRLYPIREQAFSELTEACTPFFKRILSKFISPYLKVRLLELRPGGVLTSHIDFPYYHGIRLHSVLTTNEDCWWEVNGERFQLPADGNFYWMDVGKYHSVWNFGTTPRVVLSVNLSVYHDRQGNPFYPDNDTPSLIDLLDVGGV